MFPAQFPINFARPAVRVQVTVSQATLSFLAGRGAPVLFAPGFPVLSRVLGEIKDRRVLTVVIDATPQERLALDYCEWWTSRQHRQKHLTVTNRGAIWRAQAFLRRCCWRWQWWRLWRHLSFEEV